jgi:hypothetical protein
LEAFDLRQKQTAEVTETSSRTTSTGAPTSTASVSGFRRLGLAALAEVGSDAEGADVSAVDVVVADALVEPVEVVVDGSVCFLSQ